MTVVWCPFSKISQKLAFWAFFGSKMVVFQAPWAPWAPMGAHGGPMGPLGPKSEPAGGRKFQKRHQKLAFLLFLGPKMWFLGPKWVFLGPHGAPWGPMGPKTLLWLGWLACCALPWLGLAWACPSCPGLVQQQTPATFGGQRWLHRCCWCCWTRLSQGRQDRPRPDQAKARHNKQAS